MELVKRLYDAWQKDGFGVVPAVMDPAIEYVDPPYAVEPGTRRGYEGFAGRPGDDALVFPRSDGGQWTYNDLRNRRNRVYGPALRAVGITGPVRPYDLRHTIASLWLHEGRSAVEVAAWIGNSPSMTLDTYAHVIAELADKPRISVEDVIREARGVPRAFPDSEAAAGA